MRGFEVATVEPVDGRPDDAVIDFEITANRPDCLSVIGMAREVAVRYGARFARRLGTRDSARRRSTRRHPTDPVDAGTAVRCA